MPLDILLLGPPGAGKGTQAKRISSDQGVPQIATGDMLREAIASGSELGREIEPIVRSGDLVPDELIVALIRERLAAIDTAGGFILDGFPRTLAQAKALDAMLDQIGRRLSVVLELQVDEEEVVRRMLGRAREEGRSDDTPEVIRHRLAVYRERTAPLIDYYRAKDVLVGVSADGSVEAVYCAIRTVIERAAP